MPINWQFVETTLSSERERFRESDCCSLGRGPVSWQDLRRFSVEDIEDTMGCQSPHLLGILKALVKGKANEEAGSTRLQALITGTVALKFRDRYSSGMTLLESYMLVARGTGKLAITDLNHLGVSQSYQQVWRRLKNLANYYQDVQQLTKETHIWVYDNLNLYLDLDLL